MLIIGPHAGILSAKLEPSRALPIIIGGTTIQGVGFLMSLCVYSVSELHLSLPPSSISHGTPVDDA